MPSTFEFMERSYRSVFDNEERSVWLRWTPAENVAVRFKAVITNGFWWQTEILPLEIFTGDSIPNLTRIAHNQGSVPALGQGLVPLDVVAGQTYHIRITETRPFTNSASISLTIEPRDAPAPGYFQFSGARAIPTPTGTNRYEAFIRIYKHDGSLADSNYVAQFYVGENIGELHPYYEPRHIDDGFDGDPSAAGSFLGAGLVTDNPLAGQETLVQLRVWNAADGRTYEAAQLAGRSVGRSPVTLVRAGSELDGPSYPTNIGDIHLLPPNPNFTGGRLELLSADPLRVRLVAEPAHYAIETIEIHEDSTWRYRLGLIITNTTGVAEFALPAPIDPWRFYTSRRLD